MTGKPPPPKATVMTLRFAVEVVADGWQVTVNDRPATTPRGNPLTVPSKALARAIVGELTATPGALAGKGLNDPAVAPCYRIAAGAIDVLAHGGADRATNERDLVNYTDTDLVLFRADRPEELASRQRAVWDPLCDWFAGRFGAALVVTESVIAPGQSDAARKAVAAAVAACDPFRLAALALATRAAGSIIIALVLAEGEIDAEQAFACAVVDEIFQEEKWGADAEAARARAVKRLDLAQAARFLELLREA